MSKVGQWVFEMQEDAMMMTLSQFVDKHGFAQAEVWHDVRFGTDRFEDVDPSILAEELAMSEMEGFYGS